MNSSLFKSDKFYYGLFVVLLIPALLINLGVHHVFVHTDESLRAVIALEMLLNDQFIAPTVNGLYYYNKPPLYNWIIAASYELFGYPSLVALRFPVFLAILLYGWLIIKWIGRFSSTRLGWLVAIATITSGRILFYDSFLGLIDIAFSAVIFTNFMLFYWFGKRERYFALFASTYFLSAVAYLMKGLPPIVFQGFTIIAYVIYRRNWKLLFHWSHFVGALFFIVPVGIYYLAYLEVNPQPLLDLFATLWSESSKRTVTDHGIIDSLKALYEFPIENFYHFAPWTFLIFLLFRKGTLKALWKDDFSRYVILVFAFNILVYWTSPGVHPRYLFMFVPLFFFLLFKVEAMSRPSRVNILQWVFLLVMIGGIITPWILIDAIEKLEIPHYLLVMSILSVFMIAVSWMYFKEKTKRWLLLGIYIVLVRIAFDWFVLPIRDPKGRAFAEGAMKVTEIAEGKPLYIHGPNHVHSGTSFMIERERGEILEVRDTLESGAYYLVVDWYAFPQADSLISFGTRGTDQQLILYRKK